MAAPRGSPKPNIRRPAAPEDVGNLKAATQGRQARHEVAGLLVVPSTCEIGTNFKAATKAAKSVTGRVKTHRTGVGFVLIFWQGSWQEVWQDRVTIPSPCGAMTPVKS